MAATQQAAFDSAAIRLIKAPYNELHLHLGQKADLNAHSKCPHVGREFSPPQLVPSKAHNMRILERATFELTVTPQENLCAPDT